MIKDRKPLPPGLPLGSIYDLSPQKGEKEREMKTEKKEKDKKRDKG